MAAPDHTSEKDADPSVEGQTTARHAARTVFPDVYDNSEDARDPTNTNEGEKHGVDQSGRHMVQSFH
jgi:hypothetical protein